MPVILAAEDWPAWLGEAEGEPLSLLRPAADDLLTMRPVSKAVNSVRNNGPELLEPAPLDRPAPPSLPPDARNLAQRIPSPDEVQAAQSPAGGWKKAQLAAWGV